MNAPIRRYVRHEIRRYVRHEEGADGLNTPVRGKTARPKREKPFAAEYALLAELGLGPN
jgi:hypothetical protein